MTKLYVAGVSINENPKDISPITLDHIRSADFIIGEERKYILRLLAVADARDKEFYQLNEHSSEIDKLDLLSKVILANKVIFFSDAGTPCISDPDYKFIKLCRDQKDIEIHSLAGASSITSAISISGIDASSFLFLGFPPKDNDKRKKFFDSLKTAKHTTIFMERPYALANSLQSMIDFNFKIFIALNLSSDQEESYFDKPSTIIDKLRLKKAPFIVIIPKQAK